jgi:hypothetical protein
MRDTVTHRNALCCEVASERTLEGGAQPPSRSLTTEYSANGSFFRPQTHAVFHGTVADQLTCKQLVSVSFEFLMVKLLRVYGECLGARSR